MTYTHTMTSKGQITIPKEFRDRLRLGKTGRAAISMNMNGEVVLRRPKSFEEIRTALSSRSVANQQVLTEREKAMVPEAMKRYPQYNPNRDRL